MRQLIMRLNSIYDSFLNFLHHTIRVSRVGLLKSSRFRFRNTSENVFLSKTKHFDVITFGATGIIKPFTLPVKLMYTTSSTWMTNSFCQIIISLWNSNLHQIIQIRRRSQFSLTIIHSIFSYTISRISSPLSCSEHKLHWTLLLSKLLFSAMLFHVALFRDDCLSCFTIRFYYQLM